MGLRERVGGVEHAWVFFLIKNFARCWLDCWANRGDGRQGRGGQTEEESFPDFEKFEGCECVGGG